MMTVGQKAMIMEEEADEDQIEFPEEWGKGATIQYFYLPPSLIIPPLT